jgi:hypothetical protein
MELTEKLPLQIPSLRVITGPFFKTLISVKNDTNGE